jgi:hypothetical protein
MISKLTPEQEAKVQEFYQFYLKKGLATGPSNRPVAEKAVKEMYKLISEKESKCVWVNSPIELVQFAKSNLRSNLENNLRSNLWSNLWAGQFQSSWAGFYDYYRKVVANTFSKEDNHKLDLWIDMLECSYFIVLPQLAILMDYPMSFSIDAAGKIHNGIGHAIKFRDETGVYVLHGNKVTEEEFFNADKLLKEGKIDNLEYVQKVQQNKKKVFV